jgi:benzoate-CoA ligase family protein
MNIYNHFLKAQLRAGRGGSPAVRVDGEVWTYRAIDVRTGGWAARLHADGVTPGQRVLVALPDGADFVAAFFGGLRLGAVVAIASPDVPNGQLRALAEYVGASAAVLPEGRVAECRGAAGVVEPITAASVHPVTSGIPPARQVAPDDDAVWQFTSGSSGAPKAVRHSHAAFAYAAEAYGRRVLRLTPEDVTIAAPKLHFGYALGANLLFPFSVGASIVLSDERTTAASLVAQVCRHGATVLVTTPAMVRQMAAVEDAMGDALTTLRVATSAGEALPTPLHQRWIARTGVELLDGLGMTEMCHVVVSNGIGKAAPGTVGRPVPGYDVRLCDTDGQDVPEGEPGEFWVRGPSRALGYWERSDDEARVFRGDWCVPGDMLRRIPDGRLEFCGRTDDMLKVNGQWVAPRAVEECLLRHPQVREAAVIGVPDDDGLVRPHAVIVAHRPSGALGAELQTLVREHLAPHSHPRRVIFVDTLPRTPQGKRDRAALRSLA